MGLNVCFHIKLLPILDSLAAGVHCTSQQAREIFEMMVTHHSSLVVVEGEAVPGSPDPSYAVLQLGQGGIQVAVLNRLERV